MLGVKFYEASGYYAPVALAPNEITFTGGDKHATNYHTLVGVNGLKVTSPKIILEIIKRAGKLFGSPSFSKFLVLNKSRNSFRSRLHFEFLEDTAEFIRTGKRRMSIRMWMSLLCVGSSKIDKKHKEETVYSMKLGKPSELTLANWVKREEGLVDLIYTMYIIFGEYTVHCYSDLY